MIYDSFLSFINLIETARYPLSHSCLLSRYTNIPLKIKRTGKVIKIESKNALRGLKFDTEIAKT